jgi:UDP-glucose 4-epimerase
VNGETGGKVNAERDGERDAEPEDARRRVVVTGGAGFVGRALVPKLEAAGFDVTVLDRSVAYDIRDRMACVQTIRGAWSVIHLAGVLGTDELFDAVHDAIHINVNGTVNVLDACVEAGARYVGISMPPVFPSVYTATKVCAQRLASAYHLAHGLPTCHVQAFNVFGPGQANGPGHPRKIVPALSVEGWSRVPLKVWGDGTQTVDLIHVDDLADVFVDALEVTDDSTIEAGTGTAWSVNDVARLILNVTGSPAGVEHLPMRRGEVATYIRAEGVGWEHLRRAPRLEVDQLEETIRSYRTHVTVTRPDLSATASAAASRDVA